MIKIAAWCWRIIKAIMERARQIFTKITKIEIKEDLWNSLLQFVKFGLIGVSNTLLSYFITLASLKLFQWMHMSPKIDYLVAQFVGFVISVAWSFYWNDKFVFKKEESSERIWWQALFKTYISYSTTGVFLSSALSWVWVTLLHIPKEIAPLINLIITVPLNFLLNKFWAFRKNKKESHHIEER